MADDRKERETQAEIALEDTRHSYERFVPKDFLSLLGVDNIVDVALGDHIEMKLTILSSDIRSFTTLSESMTPEENFNFINSYLSKMAPVVRSHGGVIDKYIGDAIMALFPGGADAALDAAIAMMKALDEYNAGRRRAGYKPLGIGTGLNTGFVILGTVGSEMRMDTTVIGDSVNLAFRLESLTKLYQAPILISEDTLNNLKEPSRFDVRFIDRVRVKGKSRAQSVYEVFDIDPPELREGKRRNMEDLERAIAYYHLKQVEMAWPLLEACIMRVPEDRVAALYLDRCEAYLSEGIHETTGELDVQVEWSDDFSVHDDLIDAQHQELLRQVNRLSSMIDTESEDDLEEIVGFLGQYAVEHFHTEREFMMQYEYPFFEQHRREHQRFVAQYEALAEEILSQRHDKFHMLFRVNLFLVDWLINHTTGLDRHLGRYLTHRRSEEETAVEIEACPGD